MRTGRQALSATSAAICLLILGLAPRFFLIHLQWVKGPHSPDVGEATHAALAFARQGTIADSFFSGQGPTAHLMPVAVVIAGSMERLSGVGSIPADLLLIGWVLAQWLLGYLLLWRLFTWIGTGAATLVGGMAILCLLPAFIAQECSDFRFWEGGLAALLATGNLLSIVWLAGRAAPGLFRLSLAAVLAAFTFFVSPTAGVAVYACWVWFALCCLPWCRAVQFAGLVAAALTSFLLPWTLRNAHALGEPVMLRSGFGLEFAIANHPATSTLPPYEALQERMREIHPFANPPVVAKLKAAGGEIAWSRQLGAAAWAWVRTHPVDFVWLTLRHYRQFYLPDRWQGRLTNWQEFPDARIVTIQIVSFLGLAGLAIGLWRRRRFYDLLAIYIGTVGLPYALVQPIPRYSYLVWGLFAFLAAQLLVDIVTALQSRRGGAGWAR